MERAKLEPVIFHEKYREELLELEGDTGGKRVLNVIWKMCIFVKQKRKQN